MEENKDVKQENEKKATSGTTKKTTTRKTATIAAKKTPAKTTTKKQVTGTTKKVVAGTAKKASTSKTTTKKVAEEPKVATKVEEKVEKVKVEKAESTKQPETKIEKPKVADVKKDETKTTEKPKFEPAVKIEKKKHKHLLLKTILILIIIAIILFLIHFTRNYIIVDHILAKREALQDITNYSYRINQDGRGVEYYRKDNTIMLVNKDAKTIIWSNKDKKETIFIDMTNFKAKVHNTAMSEGSYSSETAGLIFNEKPHACDYLYWITSDTVDGRDCYKVTWLTVNETSWYDKENGALMKIAVNGEQLVTEYTDWKFNELTDEDMARPNLIGYEVTEVQKDSNQ